MNWENNANESLMKIIFNCSPITGVFLTTCVLKGNHCATGKLQIVYLIGVVTNFSLFTQDTKTKCKNVNSPLVG